MRLRAVLGLIVAWAWVCLASPMLWASEEDEPAYRGDESEAMPLFERAEQAYDERRYEDAARLLEEAFTLHEHPLLTYNIGVCHRLAGEHEAALTAYRHYIQLCPRDELITDVYISIGECLLRLDRRREANEAFQHYLDLERDGEYAAQAQRAVDEGEAPSDQDRRDPEQVLEAQRLYDRAAALWRQEQFAQAAELFLRGYERMPDMHEFLYDAALCYLDVQAWNDAALTFRRYVQTPGAAHDAWAFLGECYGELLDFSEAIETYERYLELEPRGDYADEARAFVNEIMPVEGDATREETGVTPGELERARQLLTQAREDYDADRFEPSLELLQQAYQIVPARSLVCNMGMCLQAMERWADALEHFERHLQGGEEGIDAEAHLLAAECLIELHRGQDATRHIARYIELAEAHDLPDEASNRGRARELQQRAEGAGESPE